MSLIKHLRTLSRQERAAFLLRFAQRFGEAMEPYRGRHGERKWRRRVKRDRKRQKAEEGETLGS